MNNALRRTISFLRISRWEDIGPEFTQSMAATYLALLALEALQPGYVRDFLSPTPFLVLAVAGAVASPLLRRGSGAPVQPQRRVWRSLVMPLVAALIAGAFAWHILARTGVGRLPQYIIPTLLALVCFSSIIFARQGNALADSADATDESTEKRQPFQ